MLGKSGLWGLALATALGFAATATATAQTKTTLRWMTNFDAPTVELWKPVMAEFEKANPNIVVKLETVAGSGAAIYPDVLRTSMASGDPPDVFFMWGGEIAGPFIRANLARPLDDYYTKLNWKGRFADWVLTRLQRGGKTFGVPFHARGMAFWYRTDVFKTHGITEPQSYAELEAACVKLKAAGIYCASFGGKFGWHTMRLLDYFVEKQCGPAIHDQLNRLETSWNQPCTVAAYTTLKKWVDEKWLVPDFLTVAPNDARIPVYAGKAAMIIEGGWLEGALKANDQDFAKYDFFLPPTDHQPKRYPAFPEQWMIPVASKNPDIAAKFIDFITAPATQTSIRGPFAGTATVGVKGDCKVTPFDCKWVDVLGSDRQTYILTDQAYTKELADSFFEVQDGVVAGRMTPADAAKLMQDRAAAWKAKNPA